MPGGKDRQKLTLARSASEKPVAENPLVPRLRFGLL